MMMMTTKDDDNDDDTYDKDDDYDNCDQGWIQDFLIGVQIYKGSWKC